MRRPAIALALCALGACTSPPHLSKPSPSPSVSPIASPSRSGGFVARAWTSLPPALIADEEVAAAAIGKKIFIAGGLLSGNHTARVVQIFDTVTRTWSRGPDLPIPLHHPAGAAFNGKFMVIGGFTEGARGSNRTFFLTGDRWVEGPRLHHARGAAAAVAVGTRVVIAGGISGSEHVAHAEIFDGETWSDGAEIPTMRDHLAAASDGTLAYFAGGRAGGHSLGAFEAYDLGANRWTKLAALPTARSGFGACFISGRVVTAGGELAGIFGNVEAYDVGSRRWTSLPEMRTPRHGLGVVAIASTMYTVVGGTRPGLAPSTVLEAISV